MNDFTLSHDETSKRTRMAFLAFNTGVVLTLYSQNGPCTQSLIQAKQMCRKYEQLFSRTIPESDIYRINHSKGCKTHIDRRTSDLIDKALYYCRESQGTFDITIAPIIELWDMKEGIIPAPDDLKKTLPHVDWRHVQTGHDSFGDWIQLRDPDASIDLGGIAKGWIADELAAFFENDGDIEGYLIDLGGNIAVGGKKPNGKPWKIRIRDAQAEFKNRFAGYTNKDWMAGEMLGGTSLGRRSTPQCHDAKQLGSDTQEARTRQCTGCEAVKDKRSPFEECVVLERGSVVTSGVYERCFIRDGIIYHHILDPSTGYPVKPDLLSATVVCERSIDAEGFSTTLLALGRNGTSKLMNAHPEIKRVIYQ